MFQDYLEKEKQQQQQEKERKEQENWDHYIDKQIAHLVIEYEFDFQEIANLLIGLSGQNGIKNITKKRVEQRWLKIHQQRKQNKNKTPQQIRIERQAPQIANMQDPKSTMTVDELIETLPKKQRKKVDFLKVTKEDLKNQQFTDNTGNQHQINQFNILKESIKGEKDPELRQQ